MPNQKDIFQMSDEELRALSEDRRNDIIDSLEFSMNRMQYEIKRMEDYFNSNTQQSQNLLIVANLISLALLLGIPQVNFLRYYLTWVFPYLIFAIFAFLVSMKRVYFRFSVFPVITKYSFAGLKFRIAEMNALERIGKRLFKGFDRILSWSLATAVSTYLFLISFMIQFYLFYFFTTFGLCENLLFNFSLLTLGLYIFLKTKSQSGTERFKTGINIKGLRERNQNLARN